MMNTLNDTRRAEMDDYAREFNGGADLKSAAQGSVQAANPGAETPSTSTDPAGNAGAQADGQPTEVLADATSASAAADGQAPNGNQAGKPVKAGQGHADNRTAGGRQSHEANTASVQTSGTPGAR